MFPVSDWFYVLLEKQISRSKVLWLIRSSKYLKFLLFSVIFAAVMILLYVYILNSI
jgi:hypothetical protein